MIRSSFIRLALVAAVALVLLPVSAPAKNLYKQSKDSLIRDAKQRGYKVHDLVTILVSEQSTAKSAANTKTDERTRWEDALTEFIRLKFSGNDGFPFQQAITDENPAISLDARHRRDSLGSTDRTTSLLSKITAEVVSILPNNNLVIEARRTRAVNGETEIFKLTGIIRPDDVSPDNTVQSERIADLEVGLTGTGSVSDANKRGWLTWLIDQIWPF